MIFGSVRDSDFMKRRVVGLGNEPFAVHCLLGNVIIASAQSFISWDYIDTNQVILDKSQLGISIALNFYYSLSSIIEKSITRASPFFGTSRFQVSEKSNVSGEV